MIIYSKHGIKCIIISSITTHNTPQLPDSGYCTAQNLLSQSHSV